MANTRIWFRLGRLRITGWLSPDFKKLNLDAASAIVVREYPTGIGPADFLLFVDHEAVGIIEAKVKQRSEDSDDAGPGHNYYVTLSTYLWVRIRNVAGMRR